nr:MAG TPA: Protein of unknown function (DUF2939) [Caudoviricetes sp.]
MTKGTTGIFLRKNLCFLLSPYVAFYTFRHII